MPAATIVARGDIPLIMTPKHVASLTGLCLYEVYNLLNRPGCPAMRVGKLYRIPRDAFLAWCESQRLAEDEPGA